MSDFQDSAGPGDLGTDAIEQRAADWAVLRRNQRDWTEDRQVELDAWLSQSLAHRVAYLRIDAMWERTQRLAALRTPMRPSKVLVSRKSWWARTAVVVGLVVISGLFATQYLQRPRAQFVETPKGGRERLTLADGSQIELNTDTAVLLNIQPNARNVQLLRGEAYFQVNHDASRPFIVTIGNHRIVDLGTKFVVRADPGRIKVTLVSGTARLEEAGTQGENRSVVLTPGEVAIATVDTTRVSKRTSRELSESLAWQRGSVVFHNELLSNAAAELNRYGGPTLIVADSATAKLTISGTFLTNNTEEFAGAARELFGLRVEHRNGSVVLSR
jgi:transmembrane sensor